MQTLRAALLGLSQAEQDAGENNLQFESERKTVSHLTPNSAAFRVMNETTGQLHHLLRPVRL